MHFIRTFLLVILLEITAAFIFISNRGLIVNNLSTAPRYEIPTNIEELRNHRDSTDLEAADTKNETIIPFVHETDDEKQKIKKDKISTESKGAPKIETPEPAPLLIKPEEQAPLQVEPKQLKPKEEINQTATPQKPTLDENKIARAVVRIRCGKTFGSSFVLKKNGKWYALTAAHVIIDRIETQNFECDVIFPYYNPGFEYYQEAHYRIGKILSPAETEKNYKEKGFDFAVLEVLPLENKSEDARVFPAGYPFIDYSFCSATDLADKIILWGYATNIGTSASPGSILSKFEGEIVQYGDIKGVLKEESNKFAGGYEYLADLNYAADSSVQHPAVIIRSKNNFSGASGGLVFDLSKNCVIGVNVAVSIQDNQVFGLVINPGFAPIKEFFEQATK